MLVAAVVGDGVEDAIERYRLAIPLAMRELACWLLWRFEAAEKPGDKPRKVPYYASGRRRQGVQGSDEDLRALSTFDAALEALRSEKYSGIGFAHVPGCGLVSGDFDNCIDEHGAIHPGVSEFIYGANTYTEVSPSGRGIRIVWRGAMGNIKRLHEGGYNVEIFATSGFVTITGRTLCGDDVRELPADSLATIIAWTQSDNAKPAHSRLDQLGEARARDPVYQHLKASGAIKRDWFDGRSSIACPWQHEHSSGSGDSDTVYFLPNTGGYAFGHFKCLHAHCAQRQDVDFRRQLGVPELTIDYAALLGKPDAAPGMLLDVEQLRTAVGPLRWLVKHAIPANALGSIYGPPASFKSFVVLDLALSIAHGRSWLNRKSQAGGAVYVAAEGGTGLLARIDAWHKHHGLDAGSVPFRVCIVPLLLDRATDLKRLSDSVAGVGFPVNLVVLDTLSQTMGGDENEARDTSNYFKGVGAALRARFEATVVVVHHTGHTASDRPRGSSVIKGNLDFLYAIERTEGEMSCSLIGKKQKDGNEGPALPFALERIELGHDEDGDPITSLVAVYHDNAAAIITASKRPKGLSKYATILRDSMVMGPKHITMARADFYGKCGDIAYEAKKKAFYRSLDELCECGHADKTTNQVWLTETGT